MCSGSGSGSGGGGGDSASESRHRHRHFVGHFKVYNNVFFLKKTVCICVAEVGRVASDRHGIRQKAKRFLGIKEHLHHFRG